MFAPILPLDDIHAQFLQTVAQIHPDSDRLPCFLAINMFEGFHEFTIQTQADPYVNIHGLRSGDSSSSLPPLLLLHGFPQNRLIWHRVAPLLTDKYTVVILDLRGYGKSSKPEDVTAYAKSAMARDCISVMEKLRFDPFYICAHDRGARVSHKLCVDHPQWVRKAIFLDICPTLAMYPTTNFEFAKAYFHWFFLIQQEPLPETLVSQSPRSFAELFMGKRQTGALEIFDKSNFESYVEMLGDKATVHAMCHDYRASATLDLEEARNDLENGKRIKCPLRVLWGKHGVIEKMFNAVNDWRDVTDDGVTVDGYSLDSGHYLPEQVPEGVVSAIVDFFV